MMMVLKRASVKESESVYLVRNGQAHMNMSINYS